MTFGTGLGQDLQLLELKGQNRRFSSYVEKNLTILLKITSKTEFKILRRPELQN